MPSASPPASYPRSPRRPYARASLSRPIRWDVIDANYDQVIKYATAIRDGAASTEAILSRCVSAGCASGCPGRQKPCPGQHRSCEPIGHLLT
ncbi:Tn3 family transposase [Streptomyces atratus]|nr:Tn3 family transposase [Streptomyces atratus]GGT72085.1 hypothetical protein GCM10010207_82650 [Streptomyces atratus]